MTVREFLKRVTRPLRRTAYALDAYQSDRWFYCGEEGTRLRSLIGLGPGLWDIDSVRVAAAGIRINGWALPIQDGSSPLTIAVNGRAEQELRFGGTRPDLAALYPYLPHARSCGFSLTLSAAYLDLEELRLDLLRGAAPVGLPPFFIRLSPDALDVPDAARMRRVHGDANENAFKIAGYDRFRKLEEALCRVVGHGFVPGTRVLDWGCGCGRLTRHFSVRPGVAVTGVDVDVDNVRWCASHLPGATFFPVPLHPPTQLLDASFDVVIGLSVFTHLSEPVQFEWLRELKRVLTRDGYGLVSVHATDAVAQQVGWPLSLLDAWEKNGFVEAASADLDGYLVERDYYRTTFHHPVYIQGRWAKIFTEVEVVEAYVGNQALCVLKR